MSQFDKLLGRILALSNDLRFDEIEKVLKHYGYTMTSPKSGSSHCTFRKEGELPITIPRNYPVKKAYVKVVKAVVEGDKNEKQ